MIYEIKTPQEYYAIKGMMVPLYEIYIRRSKNNKLDWQGLERLIESNVGQRRFGFFIHINDYQKIDGFIVSEAIPTRLMPTPQVDCYVMHNFKRFGCYEDFLDDMWVKVIEWATERHCEDIVGYTFHDEKVYEKVVAKRFGLNKIGSIWSCKVPELESLQKKDNVLEVSNV